MKPGWIDSLHDELWPELPLEGWKDTYANLHLWTQVIGKIRMRLSPRQNHWWESALYVSPRGLTTGPIPFGRRYFRIDLDFMDHCLFIRVDDGRNRAMALSPKPVARFHQEVFQLLESLGIRLSIDPWSKELPKNVRLDQFDGIQAYDAARAHAFWRVLIQADRLLKEYAARFIGKTSPVHFFWGSFDLTVSRFSGRRAPPRENADSITREAYSHECISCGFWPGSQNIQGAAFYAYAAPEPKGYAEARVLPESAFYNAPTKNFILMYDEVRRARQPDELVRAFFQSAYQAGADLGGWDRENLERAVIRPTGFRAA